MKLYITEFNSDGKYVNKTYWINFAWSLPQQKRQADILREEYNATLHTEYDIENEVLPHIVFENERDATMFLLRWS